MQLISLCTSSFGCGNGRRVGPGANGDAAARVDPPAGVGSASGFCPKKICRITHQCSTASCLTESIRTDIVSQIALLQHDSMRARKAIADIVEILQSNIQHTGVKLEIQ